MQHSHGSQQDLDCITWAGDGLQKTNIDFEGWGPTWKRRYGHLTNSSQAVKS